MDRSSLPSSAMKEGYDATHRATNLDTHLTHGVMASFCRFRGMLSARAQRSLLQNPLLLPLFQRADGARLGAAQ